MSSSKPALAAIVLIPDEYNTVRQTMLHLQAQTVAGQIEIIFVAPSRERLGLVESDLACFHSWQIVETGELVSKGSGYVSGIHRARAPIVALTEDHSFPDSIWAELLIAAHQQPWAAVGPSMCNGNPESALSWADFYQAFGDWTHPIVSKTVSHLPAHNSSYKRDILLRYEGQLGLLMEAEGVFHGRLTTQGFGFFLESRTCTSHVNFVSLSSWMPKRYYTGREFAAIWAHTWSWPRRLLFTVASSLIPWVRLWRIQKNIRRGKSIGFLIRLVPILVLGLLVEGFGHMMGYAVGIGDSAKRVTKYEFHRV